MLTEFDAAAAFLCICTLLKTSFDFFSFLSISDRLCTRNNTIALCACVVVVTVEQPVSKVKNYYNNMYKHSCSDPSVLAEIRGNRSFASTGCVFQTILDGQPHRTGHPCRITTNCPGIVCKTV